MRISDWSSDVCSSDLHPIAFTKDDVVFAPRTRLPGHPNALTLVARDAAGAVIAEETYYSVGGGFIRRDGEPPRVSAHPYPLDFDDEIGRASGRERVCQSV